MNSEIRLSDHFDVKRLLRFTLPSIIMMIFTSIYSVVDGYFVSNFAGKTAFTAVNLIMPLLMILGSIGFMFGTGGSALIAKTLGEKQNQRANEIFSMVVVVSAALGVLLGVVGIIFLRPVAKLLGAEGELLDQCVIYARIILIAQPFFILQFEFQSLFVTAEKPRLGLYVTVAAGCANMVLDWLFVGVFSWGIAGAAVATAISQAIGGLYPLVYFARRNTSLLKIVRTKLDFGAIAKICTNGSSEFMSNISMSLVSMLYNKQLLQYAGQDGIAAYGVLMYVSMIFQAIFIGYSVGVAPVVGYHYGAKNNSELKGLLRRSLSMIGICSLAMLAAGEVLAKPLSMIFVSYDQSLFDMTCHAFAIFSLSFLFSGFSIYGSSFFTALNDGLTSALISFMRTILFQVAAVLLLPKIWQLDGIWWSIVVAEVMSVIVTVFFLIKKQKRYGY